jgi:hypothetical protein
VPSRGAASMGRWHRSRTPTVAPSAPIRMPPAPKRLTSLGASGRKDHCIQRMPFHACSERLGVLTAEPDQPGATPSRPRIDRTAAIARANDATGERRAGVAGRGWSYSFRPDYEKSATSAWVAGLPRQRAKSPRDSHRGDRSLNRGEKSRTAAYGAMAASAAQPRRALIWINLNVRSSATQTTSRRPLPAADLHRVSHRDVPRCGDMR